MKKVVLIVAGGVGQRMNTPIPKQFQELNGLPVLMHAINAFVEYDATVRIILVIHPDYKEHWISLCSDHNFNVPCEITEGGSSRFESVKNGLALLDEDCLVGVHDSVRPLVSQNTISSVFSIAEEKGNAVPCIPVSDSIRIKMDGENAAKNRDDFVLVQTPQCFQSNLLKAAYEKPHQDNFTDDASVIEANGEKINLVEGNAENFKITIPKDFIIANALLKSQD